MFGLMVFVVDVMDKIKGGFDDVFVMRENSTSRKTISFYGQTTETDPIGQCEIHTLCYIELRIKEPKIQQQKKKSKQCENVQGNVTHTP
jgi:hypothetical protein